MQLVDSYSHFHGLEFISIHHPSLMDELGQLIGGLAADEIGNANSDSAEPDTLAEMNERHWHPLAVSRIGCFAKQRVALKLCFGLDAGKETKEFSDLWARYRGDEIDVGVAVFPIEPRESMSQTASFESAVKKLKESGRTGTIVPLVLLAVRGETGPRQ